MPKKKYPKTSSLEKRIVVYYAETGTVKLVSTFSNIPGDAEVFARTMADHMDAKLIEK